jgi:1-acyl-sn-glycerol-3-phosphate acyltransferase
MDTSGSTEREPARCLAITKEGLPCRNRPLPGQQYCAIHTGWQGNVPARPPEPAPDETAEEIAIEQAEPTGPSAAQQAETTIQELEVEIRNHASSGDGADDARSMALDLLRLVRENVVRLGAEAAAQAQSLLRQGGSGSDYLDPDFWRGLGMVLEYQLKEIRGLIERRAHGQYSTDAYGMDAEIVELVRPIAGFLYRGWWRVGVSGLEHVPGSGGALLVANHAGIVPWDGMMIATAILEEHAEPRVARTLHDRWLAAAPGLAPALAAVGQAPAMPENAERLLREGQLVTVFPEGAQAAGKLFRNRYRLTGFQAGPYVRAALQAGVPIIPVAVIGAEETYPVIANLDRLARLARLPYLPITPFFPWLGLLGLVPLPRKWVIEFGQPLDTGRLTPDAANDTAQVDLLAAQLRERIEALLREGRAQRGRVFSA